MTIAHVTATAAVSTLSLSAAAAALRGAASQITWRGAPPL